MHEATIVVENSELLEDYVISQVGAIGDVPINQLVEWVLVHRGVGRPEVTGIRLTRVRRLH